MNTDPRKKKKHRMTFRKTYFKMMTNVGFGKTIENLRKHRDFKLVTTERRRNYLVSKPNYHMKKTEIHMNKPVYLRL